MPIPTEKARARAAKATLTKADKAQRKYQRELDLDAKQAELFRESPFVRFEVLRCKGPCGGYLAIAVNGRRVTSHKCAGAWQTIGTADCLNREDIKDIKDAFELAFDAKKRPHIFDRQPHMHEFIKRRR